MRSGGMVTMRPPLRSAHSAAVFDHGSSQGDDPRADPASPRHHSKSAQGRLDENNLSFYSHSRPTIRSAVWPALNSTPCAPRANTAAAPHPPRSRPPRVDLLPACHAAARFTSGISSATSKKGDPVSAGLVQPFRDPQDALCSLPARRSMERRCSPALHVSRFRTKRPSPVQTSAP